ncbi:MAG: tetratricopeptide repeat protein [Leptolyngbya sp. Prado105]|jgi:tetratricopeptide (TPR) repeat protein|nr:tetratricopeptide repeat protein [Leptolyngbya sp. Prado105]
MSQRTFTSSEPSNPSSPITPDSPIVSWGIVLIAFGIALASRALRQPKAPSQAQPFTQALHWLGHGKQLEGAKDLEGAIATYEAGLKHHPNDFRLWHERGLALAKHQRFEAALESYDRAYALRPDYRDLAHERGDTLLQLGRYEAAIVSLNSYLRYVPNNAHVLGDLGFAHYKLGRYEDAIKLLNASIANAQGDPYSMNYARHYQIKTLEKMGELSQALKAAEAAMQYNPEFKAQYEALQARIEAN